MSSETVAVIAGAVEMTAEIVEVNSKTAEALSKPGFVGDYFWFV